MGLYNRCEKDEITIKTVSENACETIYRNPDILKCFLKIKGFSKELYEHSLNVSFLTSLMGQHIYESPSKRRDLYASALLHDYGKLFFDQRILVKPELLTEEEKKAMDRHVVLGYFYLVQETNLPREVLRGISDHHERWDGSGYHQRKKEKEISAYARIIMIADVYDAMASDRVYRKKINRKFIYGHLRGQGGKQYDQELTDLFTELTINQDLDRMERDFRRHMMLYQNKKAIDTLV